MRLCGLILAAGEFSRLGRPKQLILFQGKTLLQKAIESTLEVLLAKAHVVLGARIEQISSSIEHLSATIVQNRQWQEGIGSSIRAGMEAVVVAAREYDAVLIMLCDQLHVQSPHLQALIGAYQNKLGSIVAAAFGAQLGVPALFDQKYFEALRKLKGVEGVKKIILRHPEDVHLILFEQAIIDIDTQDDLIKTGLE